MRSQLTSGTVKLPPFRCTSKKSASIRTLSTQASASVPDESELYAKPRNKYLYPRKVVLSGIQPTGVPHLGNYLGALRQWKELQAEKIASRKNNDQLFFSIVDLHALTGKHDRVQFSQQIRHTYASLLAIGLDPKESIIFVQSQVRPFQFFRYILIGQLLEYWVVADIASVR